MRLRFSILLGLLLAAAPLAHAGTGFSALLNGAQEVPPVNTPGTGTATLVLDNTGTQLSYTVTFSGLLGVTSASHIHIGAPGVIGGVVFPLNPPLGVTSGSFSGVIAVNASQVSTLMAGNYYINIHTNLFMGGEIRGQIGSDPTPNARSTWGRIKQLYR